MPRLTSGHLELGRLLVVSAASERRGELAACLAAEGFDVAQCAPADVRPALRPGRPDVVLAALDQHDASAVAFCAWVRTRSDVPLVVLTGRATTTDPALIIESGADIVLREPVGRNELVARLRALLRRTAPAPLRTRHPILVHGNLRLFRDERRLEVAGASLRLDGQEFDLMEELLLHGSKLAKRNALRTALGVSDSELDGWVRRLRERIEAVDGWRRIVTERGVGLRLLEHPATTHAPTPG